MLSCSESGDFMGLEFGKRLINFLHDTTLLIIWWQGEKFFFKITINDPLLICCPFKCCGINKLRTFKKVKQIPSINCFSIYTKNF